MGKSRAWAEIDLAAVKENLNAVRKIVFPARVLACVKANAYGLGAAVIAPFIEKDADMFGVASVAEGVELRRAGIGKGILLLGPAPEPEIEAGVENGLEFAVSDRLAASRISASALRLKKKAGVHLKIDTGMGRLGGSAEGLPEFYRWCCGLAGLSISGVFTHFPVAETRNKFTLKQIERFRRATDSLALTRHAANSAAIFKYPESYFDLVRAGIALYGSFPSAPTGFRPYKFLLKPVVVLGSRIVFLKEAGPGDSVSYGRTFKVKKKMKVATVSIGYADGYGRNLSSKASVLVGGKRCPVIGTICMDMIMVDVSGVDGAAVGDEVVLIGRQGREDIRVEEAAAWAGTVPHEIFSRLGLRVSRIYKR